MRATEADEASNAAPLPGAAPVPPPRSRLRRLLRGGFALALSVVLLALLAVVFVHTPPGRAGARALLEIWGSRATGGLIRLAQLELRVWDGQAAVTALRLALPGATLDAQRIELDWSRRRGPHVRVLRPRLVVRDTGRAEPPPQEAAGFSAQPWRVLDELGRAELVDGWVELRSQKGEPWLVLGGVSLEMAEGPAGPIRLRVGDAAVGWPDAGLRLAAASAEATLRLEGGRLVIEQARIAKGSSSIELGGSLDRILPTSSTATAHAELDGRLAGALVPGTDMTGRIAWGHRFGSGVFTKYSI